LAAYLGYRSKKNGAYLGKLSAAKLFGLIEEKNSQYVLSVRATQILMPDFDDERKQAMIDAFMSIPLFKALFDAYRSGLPEGLGLRNALRHKFGVIATRVEMAERVFFASADLAGLFDVRGSRTQLIIPPIARNRSDKPAADRPETDDDEHGDGGDDGGGGGGGGGEGEHRIKAREDLQNEYIALLINAFKAKLDKGEFDEALGAKIEKLVGLPG
jgi:hypothetical protein